MYDVILIFLLPYSSLPQWQIGILDSGKTGRNAIFLLDCAFDNVLLWNSFPIKGIILVTIFYTKTSKNAMKHMISSFKMKGDVISDHFLMLWFQKDSLDTFGFRTFRLAWAPQSEHSSYPPKSNSIFRGEELKFLTGAFFFLARGYM